MTRKKPSSPSKIPCACGCGGIVTRVPKHKKYIHDSHRKSHERHKERLSALEMGWRSEQRPCKCGCGDFFYPTLYNQQYINGHNKFWIPRAIKYEIKNYGRRYDPKIKKYGICLGVDPDTGEHCTNGKPKGRHFCPECSSRNESSDELLDYEFRFGILD